MSQMLISASSPSLNAATTAQAIQTQPQISREHIKEALALKIARHSHCSICEDCISLIPDESVTVVLDITWDNKTSEYPGYVTTCRCGHSVSDHAVSDGIAPEEYARRGRVAIRLDELLDDENKLLDFEYEDDDIVSLRKQMVLPGDTLSPLSDVIPSPGLSSIFHTTKYVLTFASEPDVMESRKHSRSSSASLQPPNKKVRMSASDVDSDYSSPLSNAEDIEGDIKDGDDDEDSASISAQAVLPEQDQDVSESDDEEERPLAVTNGNKPNIKTVPRYGGKKAAGHMTVAGTAPAPTHTGFHAKANLESLKTKVKPEELGEEAIDRLASGVTVDTEGEPVEVA
ncbi:hypothetical protein Clacol_000670 [Clathrus columnatus]|uniref:Uncharacterized protein n=1 Tax=Clathrus columnatus TaxID=1419009 RepID=A0AAV5A1H2_9AGAM|nr:hypothetical protein Clacol_000670 [Clathrus columnatus]